MLKKKKPIPQHEKWDRQAYFMLEKQMDVFPKMKKTQHIPSSDVKQKGMFPKMKQKQTWTFPKIKYNTVAFQKLIWTKQIGAFKKNEDRGVHFSKSSMTNKYISKN